MTALLGVFSLFIVLLAPAACKYSAEEATSVYYDLSISSFPVNVDATEAELLKGVTGMHLDGSSSDSANLTITNKHGQKYTCRVPTFVEPKSRSADGLQDPPSSATVTNEEIQNLLDPILNGRCLITSKESGGWWTYEFCYKSSISQYHLGDNNELEGDTIYLGHYESEKNWMSQEAINELSGKRKSTRYHKQFYTNGTLCDLTNQFRQTEVRFVCDERAALTSDAYLHSVDEPESCEYILTVRTGALCSLPAFLPTDEKQTPFKIECQPILSAPEFDAYMKAKEAEEARKQQEAARKKQEEEQTRKKQEEQKRKKEEEEQKRKLEMEMKALKDEEKASAKPNVPLLEILGKVKPDYLKIIDGKEDQSQKKQSEHTSQTDQSQKDTFETNIGAEGTIEYEYMTHWLEQELENLANDEEVEEANNIVSGENGLSDAERAAVNEFKRKNRRLSMFMLFKSQANTLVDDVLATIVWWDKKFERLGKKEKKQARHEVRVALFTSLTNLLNELDAVERNMELIDEKTDLSGLAAFREMREEAEGRKQLMQELEQSGLSTSEFVKAKIQGKLPPPTTEKKRFEDLWRELIDRKKSAPAAGSTAVDGEDASATEEKSRGNTYGEAPGEQNAMQKEMEKELTNLMGDVERELKVEGAYNELNDEQITEVKTEALRSLAKTLSTLLEKLDEAERAVASLEEKREESKSPVSSIKGKLKNKVNTWRALMEELAQSETTERDESSASKRSGAIDVKRDGKTDPTDSKEDTMRVRVSTINAGGDADEAQEQQVSGKLERLIAEKLQEAGFDTQGRPVQVKILTTLNFDANGDKSVHVLSDEEAEEFTNVVFNMLGGGGAEQTAEQRRYRSLEDSYNFGTGTGEETESTQAKKTSRMKTVVTGAGR